MEAKTNIQTNKEYFHSQSYLTCILKTGQRSICIELEICSATTENLSA